MCNLRRQRCKFDRYERFKQYYPLAQMILRISINVRYYIYTLAQIIPVHILGKPQTYWPRLKILSYVQSNVFQIIYFQMISMVLHNMRCSSNMSVQDMIKVLTQRKTNTRCFRFFLFLFT